MEIRDAQKQIEDIIADAQQKLVDLAAIDKEVKRQNKSVLAAADAVEKELGSAIDKDKFLAFFKKPYVVIPQSKNKVLVAVPKYIKNFAVGWLWKETDSFFIYQFDQYSAWLGDAPADLLSEVGIEKSLDVTISGNSINFPRGQKEEVKKKLGHLISEGTLTDTNAVVKKGRAFDVLVETIKSGCLPFKAQPVATDDLRVGKSKLTLRPYQKPVLKKFLETGAVGAFHPTGAGKSFIAMQLMDIVKGPKLLFVPNNTLKEQWHAYVEANIPHVRDELTILTYSANSRQFADRAFTLTIYDECQYLPADTFSRLALIQTKYRIGLSASPHREDGREAYIFALTGFPVGLNWSEYMEEAGRSYHPINVHVVKSKEGKLGKVRDLINPKKKTMIFCDTIDLGKEISRRFKVPYIHGETADRMRVIEENKIVAISRVGDVGVSVKDLERIIEVDFLFGSRQQQLQRTGRLMHSEESGRHDIIMTEKEVELYGKRLWALQEKGFTVKVIS